MYAVIEKDKDGYFAYIPNLEGCVSSGDTYEETLLNIQEAYELYLESLDDKQKQEVLNHFVSIVSLKASNV